jgi:hypothetical protein
VPASLARKSAVCLSGGAEVEAGGGKDGADTVPSRPLRQVAVHPVVGLEVPDRGLTPPFNNEG